MSTVKNYFSNARFDIVAGASVALVALPLSLGIALASGTPPISGVVSSILGGIIGGFFTGVKAGIKGPPAGLIAVIISGMMALDTGNPIDTYRYVLAAFLVSGFLLTLIGLLRLGKIADFFPSSVVKGMLAAVGLIILAKQINVGLGVESQHSGALDVLLNLDYYLLNLNPVVTIITLNSLVLLILLPKLKNKFINVLPPPMWVLLCSVPFVLFFDFNLERDVELFGSQFPISPEYLIQIPDNLIKSLLFPDFGAINRLDFWILVLTLTVVSAIENLASAKAIEKLDPEKRPSRLNRELVSSGLITMISSLIGGLPVLTVIVRSSVNINHGGKNQLANLSHGLVLFLIVWFLGGLIQNLPLAALAAILIFTGYRLASPKIFKDAYERGVEQLIILVITILATLATGLLGGIVFGIISTLLIHFIRTGMSWKTFASYLLKPGIKTIRETNGYVVKIKGVANFFNILRIKNHLEKLPAKQRMVLELSNARIVDYTVLEFIHDFCSTYNDNGGKMELVGLDVHDASSDHPYSIHLHVPKHIQKLSRRQQHLQQLAHDVGAEFYPERIWQTPRCDKFQFFNTRPVEFKKNSMVGKFESLNASWEIADITFDEGVLMAADVYHVTILFIDFPFKIPVFTLEKEHLTDRILELAGVMDVDFVDHKSFSRNFLLQGPNKEEIADFFSQELLDFFVNREVYHLESNANSLMLFKFFRLASADNVDKMIDFSEKLTALFSKRSKELT